ncbi:MAG: hypothetical protein OCU22_00315 [Canidatus Methanoxibalbensis ujae]|nr:hypothetical protein [Candidatus Methanoxibalbensis ujae]
MEGQRAMYALTGDVLFASFRRGLRNGNWKKLKASERAFFKAALFYLRRGGRIVSVSVLEKLRLLIEELNETRRMRIFRKGFEKAIEILNACENFAWYPYLKKWLKEPDYIFWLGTI